MVANGERGLTVAVICNGLKGEFEPATRRFYVATGGNGGSQMMAFTPTEFERHAGMAASKKWKYSVRIDVDAIPGFDWDVVQLGPYTLGRWLQEKGLDSKEVLKKSKGRGRTHANASGTPTRSTSATDVTGDEDEATDIGTPSPALRTKSLAASLTSSRWPAGGVPPASKRSRWLSPIQPSQAWHHAKGGAKGGDGGASAGGDGSAGDPMADPNFMGRGIDDFERFRTCGETGPRIGPAFQIDVPAMLAPPPSSPSSPSFPSPSCEVVTEAAAEGEGAGAGSKSRGALRSTSKSASGSLQPPARARADDPDEKRRPDRGGSLAFGGSVKEAMASASGPEKEAALRLPADAIRDVPKRGREGSHEMGSDGKGEGGEGGEDGERSDEEGRGGEGRGAREKSQRTRRVPRWLQNSVNPLARKEDQIAELASLELASGEEEEEGKEGRGDSWT